MTETERELDEMLKRGDCAFYPDQEVTTSVINNAIEQVQLGDIINIAFNWHRAVPHKMKPSMTIADSYGEIQTIHLIKRELVGK